MHIRDLTVSGEGVGTIDGLTCFVEGALPGEVVQIGPLEKKGTYAKASLKEIITPSEHRVKPICPVFGKCGGCQIMHLAYEEQLRLKKKRVVDAFERIGKLQNFTVSDCIPSPKPLYYRNKIQLPVEHGQFGLYAKRSHTLVPIRKCYIQSEAGNAVLQTIRLTPDLEQILIKTNRRGEALVVLNGKAEGKGYLEEEILGIPVRISPTSFFQVNLPQAEAMYQHAYLASGLQKGEMALDAYCGVGVFAAYLCRQGVGVVGIEVVDAAVRDAKKNAPNATFLLGAVEDRMDEVGDVDVIFLNPPRKGCEESVMEACLKKGPRTIIYTSCDPATLARDLQRLKGYGRVEAQPFDMFPQTMHVEIVAKISKIY